MGIYDIAGLVGSCFDRAVNPGNIKGGFRASEISPFNPDIFEDEDFAPAALTDRPLPDSTSDSTPPAPISHVYAESKPKSAAENQTTPAAEFDPYLVQPLPVAGPRKGTSKRARHSAVLTDTPERDALALAADKRRLNARPKKLKFMNSKTKASSSSTKTSTPDKKRVVLFVLR